MKYIEKNYATLDVMAHGRELVACQLDETSLSIPNESYPGRSGAELYELVRSMKTFPAIKQQLYKEQGGICCYCGAKLEYPYNPQYRIEHVKPKEKHRELVGEYKNLLLSCRATKEEQDERNVAPKRNRKKFMHCDEAKGALEITCSPLNSECEKYFKYMIDGGIAGTNEDAKKDIETLGLGCGYLVRRRRAALSVLFEGNELLPEELLQSFKNRVMTRDENGRFSEFCFVISDVIGQFLSTPDHGTET